MKSSVNARPIHSPEVSVDPILTEAASRLFAEVCDYTAVQSAESEGWAPEVWQAAVESGFTTASIPEEAGGGGGSLADACELLRVAGAHAAPIPLAESGILGGWLLASAGLRIPEEPATVAPGRPEDALDISYSKDGSARVTGRLHRVPWADRAIQVVYFDSSARKVLALPRATYEIAKATNAAGEPRETVIFDAAAISADSIGMANDDVTAQSLRERGALSRVMLMAGALEAMLDLTLEYTEGRVQFGRPIARFQAVQQHLVWSAQDAALVRMAAEVAARQATRGDGRFEIAAARVLANECATTATRQCHQAHGAMGMTQEHALHHLSRRLWSWRSEWASPTEWSERLGGYARDVGARDLYPLITAGSAAIAIS
jgi:acyl-CoA dehydrogenase